MLCAPDEVFGRGSLVRELLKPLAVFLLMEGVTEVCVNRPGEVWVEIGPAWKRFDVPELDFDTLIGLANAVGNFTDQDIGPNMPLLSAKLPDGERIQIVVPPACEPETVTIAIRRPNPNVKTLDEYERDGAFGRFMWARSEHMETHGAHLQNVEKRLVGFLEAGQLRKFLELAIRSKKNIAVVGDTGSGKTTLMKSMCRCIPAAERLITIEDVRELFLDHGNKTHLLYSKGGQGVAKVTPAELIGANMRLKPDRVLLAELRGGEAFDFLKLLTTGHSGSITSYHAESCALALERYVFMAKEHDQAAIYDANELKRLVSLTVDVIIHVVCDVVLDDEGEPIAKERYVAEVSYDPAAKLVARFGNAKIHRTAGTPVADNGAHS